MIGVIAAKEIREAARDGRFRLGACALGMLLVAALAVGAARTRTAQTERAALQQADQAIWLNQKAKNPHAAAHFGRYVFKPLDTLAAFDPGLDDVLGAAMRLEAHVETPPRQVPGEDEVLLPAFGVLSPAMILQVLLPLLLAFLCYGAFAGEREAGTFRQIMSLGVPRWRLLLGKALGLSSVVLMFLTTVGLAGAAFAGASGGERLPVRLAGLALAYGAYLYGFVMLGLAISAWLRSPRQALAALVGFWFVSCVLLPRVAADAVDRAMPLPDGTQFIASIRQETAEGVSGHDPADERLAALKADTLAKYNVSRLEDLPIDFDGLMLQAGEDHGNAVFDRRYNWLWDQYARQDAARRAFALLAPVIALRSASMALAGTDLLAHRRFFAEGEAARRDSIRRINEYITMNGRLGDWAFTAGPALWAQTPAFEYIPPSAREMLRAAAPDVAILLVWCALATGLAGLAIARAPVDGAA